MLTSFKVGIMTPPRGDHLALPDILDFTGGVTTINRDYFNEEANEIIDFVQSIFIDNSDSLQKITITIGGTQQRIVAMPQSQGYYPVSCPVGKLVIAAASTGGVKVPVEFFNIPMPYFTWGAITTTVLSEVIQGVFVDKSGAIAAGTVSQVLAAANANRQRIIIENPASAASQGIAGAESLFIDFGTAATINGTSLELTAGGIFDSGSSPVSTQAINVNATTINHKYIAKEM